MVTAEKKTCMPDPTVEIAQRPRRIANIARFRTRDACADILMGVAMRRLWMTLGWLDIRQRYRRAMIGPFWITISMAIMVATLGVIYASLFKLKISDFIPFLAAGFTSWFLISTTITEGTLFVVQAEAIIRNSTVPFSTHIYRLIWRNFITFGHNAVVMLGVYLYFGINPGLPVLLVVPDLIVVMLNLGAIALIVGCVCARFRDAPPIVTNVLQIVFFTTSILYHPDLLGANLRVLATWESIYYLVEALRAPFLGHVPSADVYLALAIMTVVDCIVAFLFYRRFRGRISYWL